MPPLSFDITESAGAVVVALAGELDVRGSAALDPELRRIASEPGAPVVVLDLRGLRFMDSSGLRTVVIAETALRAQRRRLALVRGVPEVQRVFEVTRMDERLTFVDDPGELAQEPPA